ncbi:TPA: hypothetical protein ACSTLU_004358 [Serratia fonticola]
MDILKNTEINPLYTAAFSAPPAAPGDGDAMLESGKSSPSKKENDGKQSLSDLILESVSKRTRQDERSVAASFLIEWSRSASPTSSDIDEFAMVMAGISDDEEDDDITDAEVDEYNRMLSILADAAVSLGADQDSVTQMVDEEDDDAAIAVADAISAATEDDDESIAIYTVSGDGDDDAMLEANKKVVRNGQVKLIRKRPRPKRINAAQRAALKKARRKSHTATANLSRRKSLRIRRKRGL